MVTTFCIATNREWITKDSSKHSLAEYHDIVAWARLAEICSKYLKKGKLVYVEGYLKTRSWDTTEGVKKFRTEVVAQDMIMLEKRPGGDDEDYIPEEDMMNNGHTEMHDHEEMPVEEEAPVKEDAPAKEPEKTEKKEEEKKTTLDISGDLGL
jgi:single-strand DNA-binding protein